MGTLAACFGMGVFIGLTIYMPIYLETVYRPHRQPVGPRAHPADGRHGDRRDHLRPRHGARRATTSGCRRRASSSRSVALAVLAAEPRGLPLLCARSAAGAVEHGARHPAAGDDGGDPERRHAAPDGHRDRHDELLPLARRCPHRRRLRRHRARRPAAGRGRARHARHACRNRSPAPGSTSPSSSAGSSRRPRPASWSRSAGSSPWRSARCGPACTSSRSRPSEPNPRFAAPARSAKAPATRSARHAMTATAVSPHDKAAILSEALPYMQRHDDAIVVVKYGGHAMGNEQMARDFARDIVLLEQAGVNPVVVHGGGPQISEMLKRLGIKSEFAAGHRITDAASVEVVEMVLAGSINKQLVGFINAAGRARRRPVGQGRQHGDRQEGDAHRRRSAFPHRAGDRPRFRRRARQRRQDGARPGHPLGHHPGAGAGRRLGRWRHVQRQRRHLRRRGRRRARRDASSAPHRRARRPRQVRAADRGARRRGRAPA